jgi:hypothetical protein
MTSVMRQDGVRTSPVRRCSIVLDATAAARPITLQPVLPSWTKPMLRILLLWEALEIAIVAIVGQVFFDDRLRYCHFLCDVAVTIRTGSLIVSGCVAIAAVVLTLFLSQRRLVRRGRPRAGLVAMITGCALAGAAVMLWDLAEGTTRGGSTYGAYTFQFWAARPLMVWPGAGVVLTLGLAVGSLYGRASRILRMAWWPVVAVLLGVFFLTYLLPATDPRVAGVHGLGVARLPQATVWLTDKAGTTLQSEQGPWLYVDGGYGGYVAIVTPGEYSAHYICVKGTHILGPVRSVPFHVSLGRVTDIPDPCPGS